MVIKAQMFLHLEKKFKCFLACKSGSELSITHRIPRHQSEELAWFLPWHLQRQRDEEANVPNETNQDYIKKKQKKREHKAGESVSFWLMVRDLAVLSQER